MSSRRSRMSLGGGALRRGVLDGSSRYNIRSAASDDEYQMTPQKSYSSRQSLGGDSLLSRSTYGAGNGATSNGVVDRRAMLEKWRQQRNAAAAASSDGNSENASVETRKRHRGDPPLQRELATQTACGSDDALKNSHGVRANACGRI